MSPKLLLSIVLLLAGQAALLVAVDSRAAAPDEPAQEADPAPAGDSEGATGEQSAASEQAGEDSDDPDVDITDQDAVDEALAEEIREGEAAQAAAAPGSNDETFVPSVQISEDLSVSFPVDI